MLGLGLGGGGGSILVPVERLAIRRSSNTFGHYVKESPCPEVSLVIKK